MSEENFCLSDLRTQVIKGQTRPETWRRHQLNRFQNLINDHEEEIIKALNQDLGKPQTEAFFELIALRQELKLAKESLKKWMQPQKIFIPMALAPGSAMVQNEPLGCVLIIGPWNYPFSLCLQPLISALAAGNTAVLKPSENAPNTSKLINKIIPKHFPNDVVRVFEGNGSVAERLIKKSFDHIFFTGGGEVGKKILKTAADFLTPVTLELGGKSPAIILEGADLEVSARRLIWGKGLNAGQTCIAPNHLLAEEKLCLSLIKSMQKAIHDFYGKRPLESNHLGKIINKHHFERLKKLLDQATENKQIICGGEIDEKENRISPTLVQIESREDPLMSEEIFGPIIPILKFKDLQETLHEIRAEPKPLALYIFGGSLEQQQTIINGTSSGGVCINDVVMQAGIPNLPFGGVGASGMGRYHGYSGFQTFSHQKSILKRPFWLDIKFRYPPYKMDTSLLKKLLG